MQLHRSSIGQVKFEQMSFHKFCQRLKVQCLFVLITSQWNLKKQEITGNFHMQWNCKVGHHLWAYCLFHGKTALANQPIEFRPCKFITKFVISEKCCKRQHKRKLIRNNTWPSVQLDISLIHCPHLWHIKLIMWREIPFLQASMYYFVSYINTVLKRSRLSLHCHFLHGSKWSKWFVCVPSKYHFSKRWKSLESTPLYIMM